MAAQAAIAMGNARLFEEKKKTERILLQQREQYSSIFNSTSDAILIYDEDGIIAETNPAADKLYGYTNRELIGMHGSLLLKQSPEEFEGIREIVKTGKSYTGTGIHQKKRRYRHTYRHGGNPFLFKDRQHLLAVIRDVSPHSGTAEALRKIEAFASTITQASPVALWMTDNKAGTTYVNQTWIDWTGRPF